MWHAYVIGRREVGQGAGTSSLRASRGACTERDSPHGQGLQPVRNACRFCLTLVVLMLVVVVVVVVVVVGGGGALVLSFGVCSVDEGVDEDISLCCCFRFDGHFAVSAGWPRSGYLFTRIPAMVLVLVVVVVVVVLLLGLVFAVLLALLFVVAFLFVATLQ